MKKELVETEHPIMDETLYKISHVIGVNTFSLFSTCDKILYMQVAEVIKTYYHNLEKTKWCNEVNQNMK